MVKHVPTNIITGALGVGKTTIIRSLLDSKPEKERWAVLVNEFGEVGIDGSFLSGEASNKTIFIKEVPGGCMCCSSGLPMQIALNLLLAQAKPHRLLIEPTGLGHPKEVLQTLTQDHYKTVLDIQGTLTLIDARKLASERWRKHPTFREQMQIADTVVLTKTDLYTEDYQPTLQHYMEELGIMSTPVEVSGHGNIDGRLLQRPRRYTVEPTDPHPHTATAQDISHVAPEHGALRVNNSGDGYYSRGWLCSAKQTFNYQKCLKVFQAISVERLKAIVNTDSGFIAFNMVDGVFEQTSLDEAKDSRIELISSDESTANRFAKIIENELKLVD